MRGYWAKPLFVGQHPWCGFFQQLRIFTNDRHNLLVVYTYSLESANDVLFYGELFGNLHRMHLNL